MIDHFFAHDQKLLTAKPRHVEKNERERQDVPFLCNKIESVYILKCVCMVPEKEKLYNQK